MKLENKIKSIGKIVNTSKLTPLDTNSAATIEEFWDKVVGPLLPDYDVMKKWHNLLIDYISLPNTVFMIRKGNEESKKYIETVKADALRRGFLTKTDSDYWFFYNDNDFATYMLAMVLDGDVIDTLTAHELLQYFKTHNAIIRFNQSGSKGIEKARAYFKIDGTQPRISKNGYTVAHIFDVNKHYYDSALGFHNVGGEDALKSSLINIDKGMYSDYKLQGTTSSRKIYYRDNYHPGKYARKFLEAHTLRFLHPLNFFCAPKDNMNGYVYCEYIDNINNRVFKRISGYEHLLYYAHHKLKEKYKDIYDDYLKRIMLPTNTFDFFEKSSSCDYFASEVINIKYGNPLSSGSVPSIKVTKKAGPKIDFGKISKTYLELDFRVGEIANQLLRTIIQNGVKSGKMSKSDIDKFKTEKGKHSTFGLSAPLLSLKLTDMNGHKSYYIEQIDCYGEKLYLNSQWIKKHKTKLIDWILDWISINGI